MEEDLSTKGDADLYREIERRQQELQARELARQAEIDQKEEQIGNAVQKLDRLLGPPNPTSKPTMADLIALNTTIREVNLFTAEEMGSNPGLATKLAFIALELLTETTRNIASTR